MKYQSPILVGITMTAVAGIVWSQDDSIQDDNGDGFLDFEEGDTIYARDINANFALTGEHISRCDAALTVTGEGNIGIGTTTPGAKLSIASEINDGVKITDGTTAGIVFLSSTLTNSFAIGTQSNHPVIFGTNNVFPQMVLATSGNIGIGTTDPPFRLTVVADAANHDVVSLNRSGVTRDWRLGIQSEGDFFIGDATAGIERLTIDTAGFVGIGTTSPEYDLDVDGIIRADNLSITSDRR